ncbi:MAG: DUF7544 domain-containing protein [Planctomycetota bacterium]|jgi:hypothetical protein
MNTQSTQTVSVIDPIGKAIDRVKEVLFNPFDLGKWFVIGFCAWLAMLGQGGGGGGSFNPGGGHRGVDPAQVKVWILEHLTLIISIGLGIFFVGLVIAIVFVWLSSRGRFMFLHCVAENKAEVKVPWHKFRDQGNSLFVFRLVLGIIGFVCMALFIGMIIAAIILMSRGSRYTAPGLIAGLVVVTLITILVGIIFALIRKFTKDFVVPIMYLRGCRCLDAWGEFWRMLTSNKWYFTVYILFQVVISIAIVSIICITGCCCCCIGCIMGIPYIGTVLLLPIFVFGRSYSLYYLAQYGGQYDVFIPIASLQEPPVVGPQGEEPVNEPPEPVQ